jgi:hypothetical protein
MSAPRTRPVARRVATRALVATSAARTALAGALVAVALAGCGLGAGPAPSDVSLLVTSGFGQRVLRPNGPLQVKGQETAMSLLTRNYTVSTSDGGGFVQSVDGLSGGQEAGQPVDWFYYVNGVEATKGADATNVRSGDRVWWDRHAWSQTEGVPAVVGSFPEPFLHGIEGERLPVRVQCASLAGDACRTVAARLHAVGVTDTVGALPAASASESRTLKVLVAPWSSIEAILAAQGLQNGPRASGVYARFSPSARALTLLDRSGAAVRTLNAGAGLIAATRQGKDAPVWLVTGTDSRGVERAASAFDQRTLADRFAVALGPGGAVALPDGASSR